MTETRQWSGPTESPGSHLLRLAARPSQMPPHWTYATIKVDWDVATTMRPDHAFKPHSVNICRKRVFVGDETTAETSTLEDYIPKKWPSLGAPFVACLEDHFEDVLQTGRCAETRRFEDWPMQRVNVDYFDWRASTGMMDAQEEAIFEVQGRLEAVADLIDALAWLAGVFRCYSSQKLFASEVELRLENNDRHGPPLIRIVPKPLRIIRRSPEIQWHHLIPAAVIVVPPTLTVHDKRMRDDFRLATSTPSQAQPRRSLKLDIRDLKTLTGESIKVTKYRGSMVLLAKTFILMPLHRRPDGSVSWRTLIITQKYPQMPVHLTTFASWDGSRPCIRNDAEQRELDQFSDRAKLVLETADSAWPLWKGSLLGKTKGNSREKFTEWAELLDAPAHYVCSGVSESSATSGRNPNNAKTSARAKEGGYRYV